MKHSLYLKIVSGISPLKNPRRPARARIALGLLALLAMPPHHPAEDLRPAVAKLQVTYSKNIEIFGILSNLTSFWEKTKPNSHFAEEARRRFLPFQAHKAVGKTESLLRKRSRPFLVHIAVHLTEFPEARLLYPSLELFSRSLLSGSVSAVRDFHAEASFEDYWEEKKPVYEQWRIRLEEKIRGIPVTDVLEDFFGVKKDRYWLILTPQTARFRMWRTLNLEGRQDGLVIFGPSSEGTDEDGFINSQDLVIEIALREFSRMFISSILDRRENLVDKYERIQKNALKTRMIPEINKSWRNFLLENLAGSVQARLGGRIYGDAVESDIRERNARAGYVLVPLIDGLIGDYESAREKYPVFDAYFPEFLAGLDKKVLTR